nr:MAG TPA: tail fiber assembly protein [Caudoviricetes sp.]
MTVTFNQDGFAETSGEITVYCTDNKGIYSHSATEYVSEGGSLSAGSYLDEPPKPKQGFVIVRVGSNWQYQADHRGIYYSKETGEKIEHTTLGELPENLTALAPLAEPCKWNGTEWVKDEAKIADNFTTTQTRLIANIDEHAAKIYSTWTHFESEYRERQAAAEAFKSANYEGECSRYISDFAQRARLDNKTAANLILTQAAGLEKLQVELANQRMRKYELKAPNLTLEQLQSIYDDIIKQMDNLMEAYQNG